MTIVVDSNLFISLFVPTSYSVKAQAKVVEWLQSETKLIAPVLFEYELTSALRRNNQAAVLSETDAISILNELRTEGIEIFPPTQNLHVRALDWAAKIQQSKAYDAHYLALAEQEDAEFWSADKRLINGLRQLNIEWAHWIGK